MNHKHTWLVSKHCRIMTSKLNRSIGTGLRVCPFTLLSCMRKNVPKFIIDMSLYNLHFNTQRSNQLVIKLKYL